MTDVSYASAGKEQSVVVKKDGTLWGAGRNEMGELGLGNTTNKAGFVKIMDDVVMAETSNSFTIALKKDGTVWSTGSNGSGQQGRGTGFQNSKVFEQITFK